jgi:hypothetical protein
LREIIPNVKNHVECPIFCPDANDPVCGTDGKDYGNLCKLKDADCNDADNEIKFAKTGPCAE